MNPGTPHHANGPWVSEGTPAPSRLPKLPVCLGILWDIVCMRNESKTHSWQNETKPNKDDHTVHPGAAGARAWVPRGTDAGPLPGVCDLAKGHLCFEGYSLYYSTLSGVLLVSGSSTELCSSSVSLSESDVRWSRGSPKLLQPPPPFPACALLCLLPTWNCTALWSCRTWTNTY